MKAPLASVIALAGAGFGIDAHAATGVGTATARVVTPIAITPVLDLRFGAFSSSAIGDTVTIATSGARTSTGAKLVSTASSGADFGQGTFSVTGDTGANGISLTYAITLPSSVTITNQTAGGGSMTVDTFVSNPSGTGSLGVGVAGSQTVSVGATVHTLNSPQIAGSYTGTYAVTVEYN